MIGLTHVLFRIRLFLSFAKHRHQTASVQDPQEVSQQIEVMHAVMKYPKLRDSWALKGSCAFKQFLIIPGSASPSIWPNVGLKSLATLPGEIQMQSLSMCAVKVGNTSAPTTNLRANTSLSFTHGLASGVMWIDLRQTFHSSEQGKATCTVSNKLAGNYNQDELNIQIK